jgi:hypothetical protein
MPGEGAVQIFAVRVFSTKFEIAWSVYTWNGDKSACEIVDIDVIDDVMNTRNSVEFIAVDDGCNSNL